MSSSSRVVPDPAALPQIANVNGVDVGGGDGGGGGGGARRDQDPIVYELLEQLREARVS